MLNQISDMKDLTSFYSYGWANFGSKNQTIDLSGTSLKSICLNGYQGKFKLPSTIEKVGLIVYGTPIISPRFSKA